MFCFFCINRDHSGERERGSNDIYLLSCFLCEFLSPRFSFYTLGFPPRRPYADAICKVISGVLVRLTTCKRSTNSLPKLSLITPVSSSSSRCFVRASISCFPSPARMLFLLQPFRNHILRSPWCFLFLFPFFSYVMVSLVLVCCRARYARILLALY